MAHALTEVASFDSPVIVPDGTDSRVDAAEKVAAIAQVLANRSQFTKNITDNAAVKNQPNTFTAQNSFNAGIVAAAITSGPITVTGGVTASGTIFANGGIDASDASIELKSAVSVAGKLNANGKLGAADGVLEVADLVLFESAAQFNQSVVLAQAADITYGPTAVTQPQRLVQVDISRAKVLEATPLYSWLHGAWDNVGSTGGALGVLEIPILLPRGTVQWSYQVVWGGLSGFTPNNAKVFRWPRSYGASGVTVIPSGTQVGATLTQTAFTGSAEASGWEGVVASGPVITNVVDPAVERWAVVVTLGESGFNRLFGLRLQFWDIGARNG